MANDNKVKLDVLLKCALCKADLVNNQSKSLPCLHTFCTHCLTNEEKQFIQDDNIVCPVCHTSVSRSSEDSEITKNLELDVIMEKLLRVRHLQQSKKRHCGMCSDESLSTHWCRDCEMFLCDVCLVHHGRYKPSDKVIDLSQGVDADKVSDFILTTKCSRHEKNFKMYCAQCEICLCSTCSLEHRSDTNVNCVPVSIGKVAPDTKSQGLHLLGETCSHLEKGNQQIEGMKLKIDSVNSQYTETSQEIWKKTEEIEMILKDNARAFIAELEAKAKNETDTIQAMIQLRQNHIKKMEIINTSFCQLLQHFDNVNIFLNFPRLKHKCLNLFAETRPVEDISCKSRMHLEYNIWYEKMRQILEDFRSEKLWIEKVRNDTPQLTLDVGEYAQTLTQALAPVPKLLDSERKISLNELTKEMKELYSCDRSISGILVCNDNCVWMCDDSLNQLNVFSAEDTFLAFCKPNDMGRPRDLCLLSPETIGVVDGNLILFEKEKDAPFLKLSKQVNTDVEYVSICSCFGKILVCDSNCRIYLLKDDGTVLKTVLDISRGASPYHRISSGPFVDTFLLLDYKSDTLFCYSLFDSKLIFTHKTGPLSSDICTDEHGNIYVVNADEIYALNPVSLQKHQLYPIGGGLIWPRIFIEKDKLYLTLNTLRHPHDTSGRCEVKIMSISY